jgi:uncharacterized MAPEG superfamily protein
MSILLWSVVGFAAWTTLTLLFGVGLNRWSLILTGRRNLTDFPADQPHGSIAYRRAVRAHANCVENLPVYAALALVISVAELSSPTIETLALIFMGARVCQTLVHVLLEETNVTVGVRFAFFFAQIITMLWMIGLICTALL